VDFLIDQRLQRLGLQPVPEADRRTLIRRLYTDLIGLPPTPLEVDAFVADTSTDAYATLVERLLANPHYGERMAIPWLDVVRYADTIGYHSDNPRNVWPYRDWVIRSFNDNKPFDRFTIEQIAGDLLPDANQETLVGSAFNRLLLSTEEGGAQPKDYESRMLADRVRAVGAVWLGQTTGCAQCHDHKFDPFSMRDFYALGAFFADIQEGLVAPREAGMPVMTESQRQRLSELDAIVSESKQTLEAAADEERDGQRVSLEEAEKERAAYYSTIPKCLVSKSASTPRTVRIQRRGNWMDESGEVIKPAFPGYLPQPAAVDREWNRLDLAHWLVSSENPLTPRVVMNRWWRHFFGIGISKVLDDLGAQGEPPTHPELLDYLACEFVESGWDSKHMVRQMVMSRAYRRSSVGTPELLAADPTNREFARQSPYRMDAELLRDQALSVAGLLDREIGGPSVKPYQPEGYWENLNFPLRTYTEDQGASQYRRGLYTWWQRSYLHPSLLAFDAPTREECCAERTQANIPQQALVLLNDPTYVEAARGLATRIVQQGGATAEDRLRWAFREVLQRSPRSEEMDPMLRLLESHRNRYSNDRIAAEALLRTGQASIPIGLDVVELAAWTHTARVLLTLHETLTRS
jgi:hypothetical protein